MLIVQIHAPSFAVDLGTAWKQMEQLKKEGLAKSIGVSNFGAEPLKQILDHCEVSY